MLDLRSKGARFDPQSGHGDFLRVCDKLLGVTCLLCLPVYLFTVLSVCASACIEEHPVFNEIITVTTTVDSRYLEVEGTR